MLGILKKRVQKIQSPEAKVEENKTELVRRTVDSLTALIKAKTAREIFDKIDVNGSGTVDLEELLLSLDHLGLELTVEEMEAFHHSCDVQVDGSITFDEFCLVIGVSSQPDTSPGDEEKR